MGDPARVIEPSAAPSSANELPEILTVDELAQLLRLNRKTVYEMVRRGEVPGVRTFGRVIRAHRDTVVRWLADGQGRSARRKSR